MENKFSILKETKLDQHPKGFVSVCTSHPLILKTCIESAKRSGITLLIESTCNQVNQYGGYTGLKPADFSKFCKDLASEIGLPPEKLILGGDHLGPSVWQKLNSQEAMKQAKLLVEQYANAGFEKIHLDASMPCADDEKPLPQEIIANRQAELCRVIESCSSKNQSQPYYVVGTEVPTPGGRLPEEDGIHVSSIVDTEKNIDLVKKSFFNQGLKKAWERTIAFVVQPGVEFADDVINEYDRPKAKTLSKLIENYENLVFEAHSTDFQSRKSLRELVADHFSILKVGPSLTYAMREGIFGLAYIEEEMAKLRKFDKSNFFKVYESVLLENPEYWESHYLGNKEEQQFKLKFSFLDRVRYYWNDKRLDNALTKLKSNLTTEKLPISLISQFLPDQYLKIKNGQFKPSVANLIEGKVLDVFENYVFAIQ